MSAILEDLESASDPIGTDTGKEFPGTRSKQYRVLLPRAHERSGRPHTARFTRMFKAGKVKFDFIAMGKDMKCRVCESHVRPKPWRRGSRLNDLEVNSVVGVDSIDTKHGRFICQVLNIVDWATVCYYFCQRVCSNGFQFVILFVKDHSSVAARRVYRIWFRIFGPPRVIKCDLGTEFGLVFIERAFLTARRLTQRVWGHPIRMQLPRDMTGFSNQCYTKVWPPWLLKPKKSPWKPLIVFVCLYDQNRYLVKNGYTPTQPVLGYLPKIHIDMPESYKHIIPRQYWHRAKDLLSQLRLNNADLPI